ncbi:PQQ-binding-like beta-propeller repeat protein [Embleya scabrispora]|uniref:outer membrane protein assembly factor BamB family protein n=1 Tax=Embleya scabrispora TaxID=159449 RepID=UPI0003624D27|nr:PQQ-binding-like beta-propeller repeat protein [Embleya scabrispora]MYS86330.1 PQQ-binding-like beta-propeller repeat protein [Streptomyces sp. SID5474]
MSTPQHPQAPDGVPDPRDPWEEQRRARAGQSTPPPFAPPAAAGTPPPFAPPPSATTPPAFAPPDRARQQPQPHIPTQAGPQPQAQPPAQTQPRPAPFPNASGGGFVANPNLPLHDPYPQPAPYPQPHPPGYAGPAGAGSPFPPTPAPMPLQPTPSTHHFVFGPPLDPSRIRPARDRPVLLRSTIWALVVLAIASVGAVRQAVRHPNGYDNTGERVAVAWALKEGRDGPKPAGVAAGNPRTLEGTWFQGDTVVRSERARVVAYRVDSGATVWEKPLPNGAAMCAAGAETDGPIAVVVYGVGTACDRIAGIDITSGTEVWSKPRAAKDAPARERVAVSRGVAVSGDTAFRIKDGAQLWVADRTFAAGCHVTGFRGGPALVANGLCGTTDAVWAVDPLTGKPAWVHKLPKDGTVPQGGSPVVATSPVIVDEPNTPGGPARLIVLSDRGEPAFPIEAGGPLIGDARDDAHKDTHDAAPRILADRRTIYVPGNNGQSVHASNAPGANQIIAVDRASGRVRWISALPAAVQLVRLSVDSKAAPIAIDPDGGLRVWVNARGSKPPRLVRFDPETGHIRVLDEYPLRLGVSLADAMPRPFEHDGRLFLVDESTAGLGYRLIAGARSKP